MDTIQLYRLSTPNSFGVNLSRHSQEFLPNTQLRVLREKDLGDKDLVWRQVPRCDCFVILNPLLRVNQNRGGFFCDSVVVGPFCQDIRSEERRVGKEL